MINGEMNNNDMNGAVVENVQFVHTLFADNDCALDTIAKRNDNLAVIQYVDKQTRTDSLSLSLSLSLSFSVHEILDDKPASII